MAHHIEVTYIINGTTCPKDRFTAAGSGISMAGVYSDVGSVVSLLDADGRLVRQVLYRHAEKIDRVLDAPELMEER